ncbi:hypothetical protein GGR53DRAFT_464387 [Hypoxylon sp. FL1150]|nr:hypothetical protein GGR53DRAFT_464387 [Hypoxylon sp. FL1150]
MKNLSITDVTSLLLASKHMREVFNATKHPVLIMDGTRDHPAFINAWLAGLMAESRLTRIRSALPQDQSALARRGDDVQARSPSIYDPQHWKFEGEPPSMEPWYEAARDKFAAANFVYDHITADIFMTLDNHGKVIAFAMKDAICEVRDLRDQ